MQITKATVLLAQVALFFLCSSVSSLTTQRPSTRRIAAIPTTFQPANNFNQESLTVLSYSRSDEASSDSIRAATSLQAATPKLMDLPAKQSRSEDSLLDTEIAIGRLFMVASVFLFAGELFTDRSISQLLMTAFVGP